MTREMIIKELENRGYKVKAQENIRNGVLKEGICIMSDLPITPIIYTEDLIRQAEEENETIEDVVTDIIDFYDRHKTVDFGIDVRELFNKEFIRKHLYVGLQKESTEELVKRSCEFDGIEKYIYARIEINQEGSYSSKLTRETLEKIGMTVDEAWKIAEVNTCEETIIVPMSKVMCEMRQIEYNDQMQEIIPLFVISNRRMINGASAILDRKRLIEFGEKYNTKKIIAIPSSVHEFLILPYTEEISIDEFTLMIKEVNCLHVDREEQLASKAFIITL